MKIFTKGNYIDFEAPIWVDDEYFNRIISFFKENFDGIKVIEVTEKDRFDNPNKTPKNPKSWEVKELVLLLNPKITINELITKLKRSEMSIKMQRAQFVPNFISWARKNNIKIEEFPDKGIVWKYLEELRK